MASWGCGRQPPHRRASYLQYQATWHMARAADGPALTGDEMKNKKKKKKEEEERTASRVMPREQERCSCCRRDGDLGLGAIFVPGELFEYAGRAGKVESRPPSNTIVSRGK